jgi:hypothetical protein
MQHRKLGNSGLIVSALGPGIDAVAGERAYRELEGVLSRAVVTSAIMRSAVVHSARTALAAIASLLAARLARLPAAVRHHADGSPCMLRTEGRRGDRSRGLAEGPYGTG